MLSLAVDIEASSDQDWEAWGKRDPYYGVLTSAQFRLEALTPESLSEFFESGRLQVDAVLKTCTARVDSGFYPKRALDFGCGVGRIAIPLAKHIDVVLGVDVSPSMLVEAERNARGFGVDNVAFLLSDDELASAEGRFDLVHSSIVLQHIPVERGRRLFERLVAKVAPGGIGAIQVTFARETYVETYGRPTAPLLRHRSERRSALGYLAERLRRLQHGAGPRSKPGKPSPVGREADPRMDMNLYDIGELLFILNRAGIGAAHLDFTNHGGVLGAYLYFRAPV
jgi:SAM-dependent methyltransferase